MRLFVAVPPPPAAVRHLAEALSDVRASHPALRWVDEQRWHLTLCFLGEVEERRLPDLTTRLSRAAGRHPPQALRFAGAGRFGGRVLWAGVQGDVEPLRRLAASVQAGVRRTGVRVENRPYRPHLTIARAREPLDLRPVVTALVDYAGPEWTARRLHLVRSTLGAQVRHDDLETWPIGGA